MNYDFPLGIEVYDEYTKFEGYHHYLNTKNASQNLVYFVFLFSRYCSWDMNRQCVLSSSVNYVQ